MIVLGGLAAVLVGGLWITASAMRVSTDRLPNDARQQARLIVMQEHLATQTEPFVILAGDSHAELLNWDRVCGLQVVNLGFSGMAAAHFDKVLARLQTDRRAEAAIVFLGTNDLSRSLKPERGASMDRFAQRLSRVFRDLRRLSAQSLYAPVFPPEGDARVSERYATHKVERYRTIASAVCLAEGCLPLEFDKLDLRFRDDGLHLDRPDRASGGALHRQVEAALCPNLK
jgi:hypothetical protein